MAGILALILAIFAQAAEAKDLFNIAVAPYTPESETLINCASLRSEHHRTICAISEVFGDRTGAAYRIAACESRLDNSAIGAAGERGIMQIHPIHKPTIEAMGMTWDDMFDPAANARMAWHISGGGQSWSAWTTRACAPAKE